ncbi:MAG: hypothetical protein GWP08_09455 [Nitrospiraceae bacterium]|nr:hypothetical protein [Nitrospiraceae bacterium]
MRNWKVLAALLGVSAGWSGVCGAAGDVWWTARPVKLVKGFAVPESVLPDPANGRLFVSNIEAEEGAYWNRDHKGFVSKLTADAEIEELRWLEKTLGVRLSSPKGMCLLNGVLYMTDNDRLLAYTIDRDPPLLVPVKLPGAEMLNDVATDGHVVYVSDTRQGVIYKVDPNGGHEVIQAPEGVNGVTCWQGRLFAVSWTLHDVYEIDPSGRKPPRPFGLASEFTNLDGIEILDDGTFIVSDYSGSRVCAIGPRGTPCRTLIKLATPADIGVDRARGLLYVPQLTRDRVAVYRLVASKEDPDADDGGSTEE